MPGREEWKAESRRRLWGQCVKCFIKAKEMLMERVLC